MSLINTTSAFLVVFILVTVVNAQRQNILFYVIDDLGWNDTNYNGAEYPTPNLDKLTSEGIRLKQYYVQPLCSPSRSALMAGRYSYNLGLAHGVITNGHPYGLSLDEVTLAQQLKNGGYSTHAIGKWDLGMHKWEYTPTYRGFDTFYGYYNADEDYFTHSCGAPPYHDPDHPSHLVHPHGVDYRRNRDPVTNQNGSYSTTLFSKEIQSIITNHNSVDGPFFIYAAYQAMHTPLEVPDQYLDKCSSITDKNRNTFCGMMQALDEGIGQITALLESKGLIDDTIIILSTDNGGQTAWGSSNWPLRGNKATVFEGGVRGFGFVWTKSLMNPNHESTQLMHITDWYPTLVEGIAGLKIDPVVSRKLDGFNMWQALMQDTASPRTEILHQLDPPKYDLPRPFMGQAAIRMGDWKLIIGQPNCTLGTGPEESGDMCPSGWVHKNGTIEEPPANPSYTWLFNVTEDPTERNNVADSNPDVVFKLTKRIEAFNSTHIEQLSPRFDPASDPKNFNGVWTPWMD